MTGSVMRLGKRITQPIVRVWQRIPLRMQGHIFVALPLLSILISAIIALVGNYQRDGIEAALQRHVQVVAHSNEVLTLMVNAETGMRGYLLTQRSTFLQPYTSALQQLPSAMGKLQALAETEPGEAVRQVKQQRLVQLQQLIDEQMTDLMWQQQHFATQRLSDIELYEHLAYGKQLMDSIREQLSLLQSEEGQLLNDRLQEINAIRQRDYLAVFLTLGVGLGTRLFARYLFHTGITSRIDALVHYLRSVRQGQIVTFLATDKQDSLGDLEREILDLDISCWQSSTEVH